MYSTGSAVASNRPNYRVSLSSYIFPFSLKLYKLTRLAYICHGGSDQELGVWNHIVYII